MRHRGTAKACDGRKTCSTCKVEKGVAEFFRDRHTADGYCYSCKSCMGVFHRRFLQARPTYAAAKMHKASLARFGMTPAEYQQILDWQNGVCCICGEPPTTKRLAVDHDHQTGESRNLLCSACNTAIGLFREDPARLRAAADYIDAWKDTDLAAVEKRLLSEVA